MHSWFYCYGGLNASEQLAGNARNSSAPVVLRTIHERQHAACPRVDVAHFLSEGILVSATETTPLMRAKFFVTNVTKHGDTSQAVAFSAVTDTKYGANGENEDNTYARWTPSASLTMFITNPSLIDKLQAGQKFYVDFTPADS